MEPLLLVILLSLDPAAKPDTEAVTARLTEAATEVQAQVKVVSGVEAQAALKERGISESDLTGGVGVGATLTRNDRSLALVRLERRLSGGDVVVETRIWANGLEDSHVAISGRRKADTPLAEPTEAVARGVKNTLGLWLSAHGKADAGGASLERLAVLAENRDWQALLTAAATCPPSPRQAYYQILALIRSGRREEAVTALTALKTAFPKHVLTASAEALIVPIRNEDGGEVDINDKTPADDGTNVLK